MKPSLVMATRSPSARPVAAVSRYCSEPSSMRMVTRLLAPGTVLPAAAAAAGSMMCSRRPVRARNGCAAIGATTTGTAPACGTTTVGAAADGTDTAGGTTTAAAGGEGCTTTGAGAGATLCSAAQAAKRAVA